jgi:hypothetical protein
MKTLLHSEKVDENEISTINDTSCRFISACKSARTQLEAAFPSKATLDEAEQRLAEERLNLHKAREHIEQVQVLLYQMQTNKHHTPIQWTTRMNENAFVVSMCRSWTRHGLYEEALQDIDSCMSRLGHALSNTEVDVSKQQALVAVHTQRASLNDMTGFHSPNQ